jgi:phosphohistidine phosphatase SixA
MYSQSTKFIENELNSIGDNVETLVITHHAPSFDNTSHEIYKDKPTTYAFASNLEHLVKKSTYWIYGHTHHNYHTQQINHKLKTNQLGYNWNEPIKNFDIDSYIIIK